jgi:hypothetical protein
MNLHRWRFWRLLAAVIAVKGLQVFNFMPYTFSIFLIGIALLWVVLSWALGF